ncbi:MAG: iron-containing alcohol dehydrogenase [Candidatus Limnocylindrales bacterium]|jgi:alcohol dehydrogenase
MEGFEYASTLRLPEIVAGPGKVAELPRIVRGFGRRALVVVRAPGFTEGEDWARIGAGLSAAGIEFEVEGVSGEPSPALVDGIVARARGRGQGGAVEVVVGIGGGSVMDTAKAVAGLLLPGNSVLDHLEGIAPGLPYRGPAVPFVAVPTTAGTGSEATKNAVLSVRGAGGFKRSFRDDALIARVAILDPELLRSCPPELIAANGMDALTQLLESYLSTHADPISDGLALRGLAAARDGLLAWHEMAVAGLGAAPASDAARAAMATAALCSGICLAQTGLGAVHGVASPLGALFPIPHGVACGATLVAATRVNVAALEQREPQNAALGRYAGLGRVLAGAAPTSLQDDRLARTALVQTLEDCRVRLGVPRLSAYGIAAADIPAIVADSRGSSMRTNPILLTDDEIASILRQSL